MQLAAAPDAELLAAEESTVEQVAVVQLDFAKLSMALVATAVLQARKMVPAEAVQAMVLTAVPAELALMMALVANDVAGALAVESVLLDLHVSVVPVTFFAVENAAELMTVVTQTPAAGELAEFLVAVILVPSAAVISLVE